MGQNAHTDLPLLPPIFAQWFADRAMAPRAHQLEMLAQAQKSRHSLLIAPTGAGKTLAGFLPTLVELHQLGRPASARRIHTIYISPLKALAYDIDRNVSRPIADMDLDVTIDVRNADTSSARRKAQLASPPDILLTTPEQLALLVGTPGAAHVFSGLRRIIIDEAHAMAWGKRGDLLALCLARIQHWAPLAQRVGLSATVAQPQHLARWLAPQLPDEEDMADIIFGPDGARAQVDVLLPQGHVPWAGHTGRYAIKDVLAQVAAHHITLIFVNTRFQAELLFQEIWKENDAGLPIALHHGALDADQKRRVEQAMVAGQLRGVVTTATLDMGLDWGDVDLVIQMGAPKGASRLVQRIGRAGHQLDVASKAILVPTNRFEMLECRVAQRAVYQGHLDAPPLRQGALDVLCQYIMGRGVGEGFTPDELYNEVRCADPYHGLTRKDFDDCLDFVRDGGYALRAYDRFQRLVPQRRKDANAPRSSQLVVRNEDMAREWRMNVGTILEAPMVHVTVTGKEAGARRIGQVESYFAEMLSVGDTFVFAGEIWRYERLAQNTLYVSRAVAKDPTVPSWGGGTFPLSTFLAEGVRGLIADSHDWHRLEPPVREWLERQADYSAIPSRQQLLIETFPSGNRHYLVAFPFEGRLAHQTLAMLVTKRLERAGCGPLGFALSDYALSIWAMRPMGALDMDALFTPDILGDELDEWMADSTLMRRTFARCAQIAGLVAGRSLDGPNSGRKRAFSPDLIYDVLRKHQNDHVLLRAAWADAAEGLMDVHRLGDLLRRVRGQLVHRDLEGISPFSVPVMLDLSRVSVRTGESLDDMLALVAELPHKP